MKIFFNCLTLIILLITIGCSTKLSYYNSTADNTPFSRSIFTDAKLINWPEDTRFSFGVVVATDKNTSDSSLTHYALFIPGSSGVNEISDLRIEYASPVMKKDLEYFAAELDRILRNWSKKTSLEEGTYYEFLSTPDKYLDSENSSELGWYPSVKFDFQNTEKKMIGLLTLGPPNSKYKYKFDDMRELAALQMVVAKSITEIRNLED